MMLRWSMTVMPRVDFTPGLDRDVAVDTVEQLRMRQHEDSERIVYRGTLGGTGVVAER